MCLVCFTLCIPTGAFGAHFNTIDIVFKFARRAIGTLGAACFGGTAGSTLVAWTLSIFVRGKRIFRAKMAFLGTSGIVEFTLQIEQETKSTIHATTRKEVRIVVKLGLLRKTQKVNVDTSVANKTYRNAGQTRTLTDVVAVVPGWAISAGDRNRVTAVAVFTFGTR